MSKENQTKRDMKSELDRMLEATGLGVDFLSKEEKKEFIKYVQGIGETIPPKEFHTGRNNYKYAFSGDWEKVDMKLTTIGERKDEQEKQIEEMARDLCDIECKGMKCNICDSYGCEYRMQAEALYNAGYRKQSEGGWEPHEEFAILLQTHIICGYICSCCENESDEATKFCPNCGAKMKGGEK